jgi:uncharacterized SAM-binding protein YcdF (DUF218 family)
MVCDEQKVALVLGAKVLPDGSPSPSLRRRACHAAKLWHAGQVERIIACGGGQPVSEAQVIRDICLQAGVAPQAITLEPRSATTLENLLFAKPLLDPEQTQHVVIVTDAYHAPRAALVAKRLGMRAQSDCPRLEHWQPRLIAREAIAYVYYWLSGRGRRG